MAYEGPPAMTRTAIGPGFEIAQSYIPDMITAVNPPLTRWICTVGGVPTPIINFIWFTRHFAKLNLAGLPPPPIVQVFLGYSPIHPNLITVFSTLYPAWDPILVPVG